MIVGHKAADITTKEKNACTAVGKYLVKQEVRFAALDFIEEYLMEVNITCPGGVTEFNEQYGVKLEERIVSLLMAPIK